MKTVAVYTVYVVGMHHWGCHELCVGEFYFIKDEPENTKDKNAIAIFADDELKCKRAYLCLLYTSPSPRDLSTSRMPSSA